MTKTIVYVALIAGLIVALFGSAGSVMGKDKEEKGKAKAEAPKAPRVEPPRSRPVQQPRTRPVEQPRTRQIEQPRVRQFEQPRARQAEPPKTTRPAEQPRRIELQKPEIPKTPKVEVRGGRNEPPRVGGQVPRQPDLKGPQTPKAAPKVTLPRPDQTPGGRGGNVPPQRGAGGSESDIQQRLRDRLKDSPQAIDKAKDGVKLPGADRKIAPRDNPPQRGPGSSESDIQQRLRDRVKEPPQGTDKPKDGVKLPGVDRKVAPRDIPPRGGDKSPGGVKVPGGVKTPDGKPGLPGPGDRGKDGVNPPKLPEGGRPGAGDRVRPDGKPGIDLGDVKKRPERDLVDKRPSRLPVKIDKDGDIAKIAEKPELKEKFKDIQRVRDPEDFRKKWNELRDRDDVRQDPRLKDVNLNRVSGGFQARLVDRDWDNLRRTKLAARVNLDRQFGLYGRGDVARQLNLTANLSNRGGWGHRYYGPIAPVYRANHFSIWYPGASWYPRSVWCPRWSPWVAWSWWSHPAIFFDPRPIYCRPAIWDPCPTWVYYDYPVWQPLPVVTCGTWVDVPVVQVAPQAIDVQILAVRFVDPGHPEQAIGPRFRLWARNNSPVDIVSPFNVLMLASATTHADASLPQAGATIDRIGAGETLAVDVRLPFEANRVAKDDQGRSVPFNFLHALVDSHRQLNEVDEANNGAVLARGDILPVDPAAFSTDVTAAAPGSVVTLAGEGLGPEPGQVIVTFNGLEQDAEIHGWYDLGIQFKLPNLPLATAIDADVVVVRGDGAVSNPVTVQITPAAMLSEAPPLAVPPLPAP